MIIQWCEHEPCRGPLCPDALARQGQPTFGHSIPVPPQPHDRAVIISLMARHLREAVVRDEQGLRRQMPQEFDFTIHHMVMNDGTQYYTALYSGAANPLPLLAAAPLAPPPGPAQGPHGTAQHPGATGPAGAPTAGRWDADSDAISDRMNTLTSDHTEPPELETPGVATHTRTW